jgi:DNA helicase HerA-like ATPase
MIFQDIMNMMSRSNPDSSVNTFLGLDEAWILLSRRGSRRIINLLRLARGYGLSIAMATQSFRDFGDLWDLVVENTGLLIIMSNPNRRFWEESLNFLKIGWRTLEDLITIMKRGDAIIRILPDPRAIPVSIERIE